MNVKMFMEHFGQLINRIYQFQDTQESMGDIKNKIYEFLNRNYDVYLNSTSEERETIRDLVKKHHTGSKSPNMLDLFLIGYIQMAAKNIQSTGDKTWLLRGLVVSSIENSLLDQRDSTFSLSYLYVMAEERNQNPESEFQAVAEISSNEPSYLGTISMNELMKNIPSIARKTYDNWKRFH